MSVRARYIGALLFGIVFALSPVCATLADAQQTIPVQGKVTDTNGNPVAGATVTLSGPQTLSTTSANDGTFSLPAVPPGLYTIVTRKSGYQPVTQASIAVVAGQPNTVNVSLAQQTLTSLQLIGHVSTSSQSPINTSPASVVVIPQQTFADQGATQVMQVLDETPGIFSQYPGGTANPAAASSVALPIIRGSLSYETASLIDGHPLATQSYGDFVITYLNPFMFQSVEVIKGPGASSTQDNYAINGTVNFRTLEPTLTRQGSVLLGVDGFGGQFSNFRATGTVLKGKLGYALDYSVTGSPGPLRGAQGLFTGFSPSSTYPVYINGVLVGSYATTTPAHPPPNVQNVPYSVASLVGCCYPMSTTYQNKSELAKLRYNFSQTTSLTASFLGSQSWGNQSSTGLYNFPVTFSPGSALYNNAPNQPKAGSTVNTLTNLYEPPDQPESNNQPMFQGEFRTSITSNDTLLARYYTAVINREVYDSLNSPTQTYTTPMILNGTFTPAAAGASPVVFNNQLASVTFGGQYYREVEYDSLHGGSFEFDHVFPKSGDLISLALDGTSTTSQEYEYEPTLQAYLIPPGSKEVLMTGLLKGLFNLGSADRYQLTLTNYFNTYYFRYSSDNGVNFQNQHSTNYTPRAGLVYRPNNNTAIRFSVGGAIAPPYLYLLSTQNTAPSVAAGGLYATQTIAPPNGVKPETAFGYDAGADVRFGNNNVLSTDVYLNNVHNQFVEPYFLNGWCNSSCTAPTPPGTGIPLYAKTVENLSNARYAGWEVSLKHDPLVGLGGLVQGSLMRAYAYNVGPCFYTINSSAGCTVPTTNLGIVNDVNYGSSNSLSASGTYNTLGYAVPYALGYGEIHYRSPHGGLWLLGMQYYGNNNSFQEPPFVVLNASIRFPVYDAKTFLQLSAYNLTNAYGAGIGTAFAGTPSVVLQNGKIGLTNAKALGPTVWRL